MTFGIGGEQYVLSMSRFAEARSWTTDAVAGVSCTVDAMTLPVTGSYRRVDSTEVRPFAGTVPFEYTGSPAVRAMPPVRRTS